MIGSGLKKYAAAQGLQVKNGRAFGVWRGYMLTLHEGQGWKCASFAARIPQGPAQAELAAMANDKQMKKQYRLQQLQQSERCVTIYFTDTVGTMKRIEAFLDFFVQRLAAWQAVGAGCCSQCGQSFAGTQPAAVEIGGVVYPMHEQCAAAVGRQMEQAYQEKKASGSLSKGILGACIGALLGAVLWAIVYYLGWVVAWIGLLIALAASKGYDLMNGTQSKAKPVVVLICSLAAVVLGQFAALAVAVSTELQLSLPNALSVAVQLLGIDSELTSAFTGDLILGLFFALLGVAGLIIGQFREHSKKNRSVTKL